MEAGRYGRDTTEAKPGPAYRWSTFLLQAVGLRGLFTVVCSLSSV